MALTSLRPSSRPLVIPPPGLICTQSAVVYVGAFLKSPLLSSATKAFTTSRTSCSSSAPVQSQSDIASQLQTEEASQFYPLMVITEHRCTETLTAWRGVAFILSALSPSPVSKAPR